MGASARDVLEESVECAVDLDYYYTVCRWRGRRGEDLHGSVLSLVDVVFE